MKKLKSLCENSAAYLFMLLVLSFMGVTAVTYGQEKKIKNPVKINVQIKGEDPVTTFQTDLSQAQKIIVVDKNDKNYSWLNPGQYAVSNGTLVLKSCPPYCPPTCSGGRVADKPKLNK